MEKIRYGLIGCGRISPNHVAAAVHHADNLAFVAMCDLLEERMEQKKQFITDGQSPRFYQDYHEMLRVEKPELVAIATDSGKHFSIAMDCMDASCNVIVEKPLALSMDDARSLVNKAKEKGVKLCTCHQNRFNKSIQKIRSAYEQNRFGKMLYGTAHIRWNRSEDYYKQAPWRGTWASDGGALMNQCIHNIDLLRWMMGDEVDEVFALTGRLMHPYIEAEDLGLALVRFKNGSYGVIEGTTNIYPHNLEETLYLFGSTGTVKAGGKSVNTIEEWAFADDENDSQAIKDEFCENPPNVYGFGHKPLYGDMIQAIRENRNPYVDGEAGLRAVEMVLAIYLSAATGKPVKLPLEHCSTLDFIGRF